MVRRFERGDVFALCGLTVAPDAEAVRKTYAVFEDSGGRILRLVEKPRRAINQYQGTGNCIFSNGILAYIEHTPISQARNEKELPDLIQCAIDDGHMVQSFLVGGKYININTVQDVALAEDAIGVRT
jgi:dTDP-glucose pyrophosphorylase